MNGLGDKISFMKTPSVRSERPGTMIDQLAADLDIVGVRWKWHIILRGRDPIQTDLQRSY